MQVLAETDSSLMAFLKSPKFSRADMWSTRKPRSQPTSGQEAEGQQVAATRGRSVCQGRLGGAAHKPPEHPCPVLAGPPVRVTGDSAPHGHAITRQVPPRHVPAGSPAGRKGRDSPGIPGVRGLPRCTLDLLRTARGICPAAVMAAGRPDLCSPRAWTLPPSPQGDRPKVSSRQLKVPASGPDVCPLQQSSKKK